MVLLMNIVLINKHKAQGTKDSLIDSTSISHVEA